VVTKEKRKKKQEQKVEEKQTNKQTSNMESPSNVFQCRSPRADRADYAGCQSEYEKLNAFTVFDQAEFEICAEELSENVTRFIHEQAHLLKKLEQLMHKQAHAATTRLTEIDSVLDINKFTGTETELANLKVTRKCKVLALQQHLSRMDTLKSQLDGLRALGTCVDTNIHA